VYKKGYNKMAHLIISTEYRANQPSIFLFEKGIYYGDRMYAASRNYPIDVNYWRGATCSDSGRYFKVIEVEVTDDQLAKIAQLQAAVDANSNMIYRTSWPHIKSNWRRRIGLSLIHI
jgi:hypothetical protein